MELLEVKNLRKVYNTMLGASRCIALDDVSFGIEQGEFVAIMGPSGSGKTTLLNLLASLDKPTSGEIYLMNKSYLKIKDSELAHYRRENLGFVFQDFNLLDSFSVKDNVLLPLVLSSEPIPKMKEKFTSVAASLNISDLAEKFPYEISGGEKQRAAVARAIITEPKLLLADEPTGALDSKASTELLKLFTKINENGQTVLMVTHSALAASYAKRVIFIKDGKLFNQIYRAHLTKSAFREKINEAISVLSKGADEDE